MHAHKVNSYGTKLYPTYGALFGVSYVQCMFMTVFAFWLVASQSICQPSFVLSGNTASASKILKPKLCQMSPLYLPICGISMSFQVNLRASTLIFEIIFFVCARTAHEAAGGGQYFPCQVCYSHDECLFTCHCTREWLVIGMPSPT